MTISSLWSSYSHWSQVTILFLSCLFVCLFVCMSVCLFVCPEIFSALVLVAAFALCTFISIWFQILELSLILAVVKLSL